MSAAVIRLKRKATSEPIDGLVVALKKSKCDETVSSSEVYFKFAATLKSEKESIKDHIQAALNKEKETKFSKWRDPKCSAVNQKNVSNVCEKLKQEFKAASEKKKYDLLNNRRLIFAETVPIEDLNKDSLSRNAEVRQLFQLYDIIEENEEPKPKKKIDETVSSITCNGVLLIPEKTTDYVYDVYIAEGQIDDSFVENTISLRPCTVTNEDLYSGDSDSEVYEDEDDSNDENNWRNEYPEDENSHSESESDEEYDEALYYGELEYHLRRANLDDEDEQLFSSDEDPYICSEELISVPEAYDDSD